MKKTSAHVRPRSSAGKRAETGRRSDGSAARALPTKTRSKKAPASAASARTSRTSNDADDTRAKKRSNPAPKGKRITIDALATDDNWHFDGKTLSRTETAGVPDQDSNPISEWTLRPVPKKPVFDIFAAPTEIKFSTRANAIEHFNRAYAKSEHTGAVSLICPDGSSEDLKLNGVVVNNSKVAPESRTVDGFWQVWTLTGAIRNGYSTYPAAVATFDACWRDDADTRNVFLVEHREDGRKPRERWLKRNGRTVI